MSKVPLYGRYLDLVERGGVPVQVVGDTRTGYG